MTKRVACTLLICFALVSGCTRETVTPPPAPEQLVHLPVKATTIGCPGELRPPGVISAFELPGLTPEDNSGGSSNRGNQWVVPYCEEVDVIDYAWSEMDEMYYLQIRLKNGRKGWMWQLDVTLR